jgi:hypothetical protein
MITAFIGFVVLVVKIRLQKATKYLLLRQIKDCLRAGIQSFVQSMKISRPTLKPD